MTITHPLFRDMEETPLHHQAFLYEPLPFSIVIASYDRPNALNVTLASLMNMKYMREIIIGLQNSDGSTCLDEYGEKLIEAYHQKGVGIYVFTSRNFIHGMKYGASKARWNTILLLDDDIVPGTDYEHLSAHLNFPEIGAVSGTLQSPIDEGYSEWSEEPIIVDPSNDLCNEFYIDDGDFTWVNKYQVYRISDGRFYFRCKYLLGGAMFIRKELVELFDDKLARFDKNGDPIIVGNEIDLSFSIRKKGLTLVYDAKRIAWHLHAGEGRNRAWDRSEGLKSWNYLLKKHGLPTVDNYPKSRVMEGIKYGAIGDTHFRRA